MSKADNPSLDTVDQKYRVTGANIHRRATGEKFVRGEVFCPTEEELALNHRKLEPVAMHSARRSVTGVTGQSSVDKPAFDAAGFIEDKSVSKLEAAMADGDYDGHLDALLEAEKADRDRKSAKDLIEGRMA